MNIQQAMAAVNDRNTTETTLQAIADQYPDLWLEVASHPNAYPALLDWLNDVGDTEVQAAVTARRVAVQRPATAAPAPPTLMLPNVLSRTRTGAPPPPVVNPRITSRLTPRKDISKPILILIVALAVAVVAVYITLINLQVFHKDSPASPPSIQPTVTTTTTTPSTPTQTVTVTPSPPVDPESVAYANLTNQLKVDMPSVEAILQNQWSPLLATKEIGTLPDGSTWTYSQIWQLYQTLNRTYGSVLLVQGNTFSSPGLGPQWFLMFYSGTTYTTPQGALNWCTAQSLPDSDCWAFRLTNTPGTNQMHNT